MYCWHLQWAHHLIHDGILDSHGWIQGFLKGAMVTRCSWSTWASGGHQVAEQGIERRGTHLPLLLSTAYLGSGGAPELALPYFSWGAEFKQGDSTQIPPSSACTQPNTHRPRPPPLYPPLPESRCWKRNSHATATVPSQAQHPTQPVPTDPGWRRAGAALERSLCLSARDNGSSDGGCSSSQCQLLASK